MTDEPEDYRPRQNKRDADYRREYAAWLTSLTPAQFARVKAAGLDQPVHDANGHGAHFPDRDLAETSLAATDFPLSTASNQHVTSRATKGSANFFL